MKTDTLRSKLKFIFHNLTEFDRKAEREVKRSIRIWHQKGKINQIRAKIKWNRVRKKYSCDIYPGITVGKDLRIEHPMGICIGKTAMLGDRVRIYNYSLIIAKVVGDEHRRQNNERRHAKIGNDVVLGCGCTIIGPVCIGDDCIIGARAIVTHDIPPHSVVTGTNCIRQKRESDQIPHYYVVSEKGNIQSMP